MTDKPIYIVKNFLEVREKIKELGLSNNGFIYADEPYKMKGLNFSKLDKPLFVKEHKENLLELNILRGSK